MENELQGLKKIMESDITNDSKLGWLEINRDFSGYPEVREQAREYISQLVNEEAKEIVYG